MRRNALRRGPEAAGRSRPESELQGVAEVAVPRMARERRRASTHLRTDDAFRGAPWTGSKAMSFRRAGQSSVDTSPPPPARVTAVSTRTPPGEPRCSPVTWARRSSRRTCCDWPDARRIDRHPSLHSLFHDPERLYLSPIGEPSKSCKPWPRLQKRPFRRLRPCRSSDEREASLVESVDTEVERSLGLGTRRPGV